MRLLSILIWACLGGAAWASPLSLLPEPGAGGARPAFIDLGRGDPPALRAALPNRSAAEAAAAAAPNTLQPSLFMGREPGTFFEPFPKRETARLVHKLQRQGTSRRGVAGLRDFIAVAEAGAKGYDAVQHGARVKPAKRPTEMTVAEIFAWIKATPGQPHAIGRYQIIPKTLRYLVAELGVDERLVFSPGLQDMMADHLMRGAGLDRFLAGELGKVAFMNNLAKVWAGLPTSAGKSYYHGYAGNYSTVKWGVYKREMDTLFPGAS